MLREPDELGEVLSSLRALGLRLVLDDFLTGFSSPSHLPRLPPDALKIDRTSVDGLGAEPHDTAITQAIVALARALSLAVVAEGVERKRQARELLRLGCELAQGYYFSRPGAPGAISAIRREGPGWPAPPAG